MSFSSDVNMLIYQVMFNQLQHHHVLQVMCHHLNLIQVPQIIVTEEQLQVYQHQQQ